jgi:Flp pilus assembly protein TadG
MRQAPALLRCRRGLAALEFALLFPLMLTLFCVVVEIGNFLTVNRKVVQAAQNAADLLTQEKTLGNTNFDDLIAALKLILQPYPDASIAYQITSVVYDASTGAPAVGWQKNYGTLASGATAPTSTATGLGLAGESSLVVKLSYQYTPIFSNIVSTSLTIAESAVARPRRVRVIPCTATGC